MAAAPQQLQYDAPAAPPQMLQYDAEPPKTADKPATPSAASRLGTNFLSGLGVTSNEQAKNFFEHPLDTVIKSFEAQGELAKKARDAYKRGDYMEALQHGLNYLVPFVGQQTDQAGTQLKEGDIAGGIGRTLGAAVPIVAGSPEVQATASDVAGSAASTAAKAVRATARATNAALEKAPATIGTAAGGAAGAMTHLPYGTEVGAGLGAVIGKEILPKIRIPGEGFGLPNRVTGGPATVTPFEPTPRSAPDLPAAFQPRPARLAGPAGTADNPFHAPADAVPVRQSPELPAAFQPRPTQLAGPVGSAGNPFQAPQSLADLSGAPNAAAPAAEVQAVAPEAAAPKTLRDLSGDSLPRTPAGESVLREELTKQPNNILLKIAKSRGVDVSQESLLKPSNAVNNRIISKIVDDFDTDELDEMRSRRIDIDRAGRHDFGDIGKEANQTISLQTYFPDLKIPLAQVLRSQKAIQAVGAAKFRPLSDLGGQLKQAAAESAADAAPAKPPVSAAADASDLEKLQQMLKAVKKGKKLSDLTAANQ